MNAPAKLGAFVSLGDTLSNEELDVVCAICNRRRGDHWGKRGVYCPAGNGWNRRSTFVPSPVSQDQTKASMLADAMVHARRRGVLPIYKAIRGTVMGPGGPITDAVVGFELENEADVLGVWGEVLP